MSHWIQFASHRICIKLITFHFASHWIRCGFIWSLRVCQWIWNARHCKCCRSHCKYLRMPL